MSASSKPRFNTASKAMRTKITVEPMTTSTSGEKFTAKTNGTEENFTAAFHRQHTVPEEEEYDCSIKKPRF